jgi:hypothetical protein
MTVNNVNYRRLWDAVERNGEWVSPRGIRCKELLGRTSTFWAGEVVGRKGMNAALGFMEGLQFLGGVANLDAIKAVAPKADLSLWDAMSFYGLRTGEQLPEVIRVLASDHASRKAVLTVAYNASPVEDLVKGMTPCTLALQFLIRNDYLHTIAFMRSSDLVWGVPYDVIQFSVVAMAVARVLGVTPYTVSLVAGSAHIYESTMGNRPEGDPRFFGLADFLPSDLEGLVHWAQHQVEHPGGWEGGLPSGIISLLTPAAWRKEM